MKIKCNVAAEGSCPHDLDICCGTCGFRANCGNACMGTDKLDPQKCPDAEVIHDELMQFQSAVPETIQKITQLIRLKKQLDEQEKELKATLVKAMESYDVKSFENDLIKMVYVAPSTRSSIDTAKLKKFHPDVAELCTKTSEVSASVRVTLK